MQPLLLLLLLLLLLPNAALWFTDLSYSAWPPINRKAIGAMASLGALESAFLTYQKLNPAGLDLLCGASGGCLDVLNGPYSNVLVSFYCFRRVLAVVAFGVWPCAGGAFSLCVVTAVSRGLRWRPFSLRLVLFAPFEIAQHSL